VNYWGEEERYGIHDVVDLARYVGGLDSRRPRMEGADFLATTLEHIGMFDEAPCPNVVAL